MPVIFITGASSGIGEAIAREYVSRFKSQNQIKDLILILLARRVEKLQSFKSEFEKVGCKVDVFQTDVTNSQNLKQTAEEVRRRWGKCDVVYANAGFGVSGFFEKLTLEDYRRQFETNVFGLLDTTYQTVEMLKKSKGKLALIGSVASYISMAGGSPYCMSKFAVRAFSHSLRAELKPEGVSVTLITPGFIESEIRKVDNHGKLHQTEADPIPSWITMKASVAAKQIVSAVEARKREKIVTFHGVLLVYAVRFFQGLMNVLLERGIKARTEPKS